MKQKLLETVKQGFAGRWVMVVGDLMLDRYLWGRVERISPEAPVPVVLLEKESECAGGAANVAANLAGLGVATRLCGFVGTDGNGIRLKQIIQQQGINNSGLVHTANHPTTSKTRVLGGHQQMMRVDREKHAPYSAQETQALIDAIRSQLADKPAMVILSDYAKGVLSEQLCQYVIGAARTAGIPVLVDPKGRDYDKYRGATALTPNKKETAEACGVDPNNSAALLQKAEALRQQLQLSFLAVTRGEEGISLLQEQQPPLHFPASARQVFDVSGAGDTVIATLAAGLIAGLDNAQALQLANLAAGVVVGKVGTAPIQKQDLLHELTLRSSEAQSDKICDLETLLIRVGNWRSQKQKVVFTNGCFDLLHAGHVTYLEAARKLGDRLVLGLNTDRSVRALKGPSRPVIQEQDRARVLAALEAVDAVILFDEDTPLQLIEAVQPDVLAKGSDYREDQVVGGSQVKAWGGAVALVELVPGRSSSNIIQKLAG